jgi:hypothetical protein
MLVSAFAMSPVSAKSYNYEHTFKYGEYFEINEKNYAEYGYTYACAFNVYKGMPKLFSLLEQGNHAGFWDHNQYTKFRAIGIGEWTWNYHGDHYHAIVTA